jgi:CheY-like chemotaxis protein
VPLSSIEQQKILPSLILNCESAKVKRPTLLFVHNGSDYRGHIQHLIHAGFRVTETGAYATLAETLKLQPDLIVLDFGFAGELTAQLKAHSMTRDIPIVVLAELTRPSR